MQRAIALLLLAGASTFAHAQWQGQAQSVDTYTWGAPETQKPKVKRTRPTYVNPPPAPVTATVPPAVPRGAIDVQSGQYLPPAAGGVVNPQTGAFYPSVPGGYINTQTGGFMPAH
ncbi:MULTISPECIES: hypothetical protein [Cupriavidus]